VAPLINIQRRRGYGHLTDSRYGHARLRRLLALAEIAAAAAAMDVAPVRRKKFLCF